MAPKQIKAKPTLKLIRDEWRVSRPMLDVLRRTDGPLEGPKAFITFVLILAVLLLLFA